MKNKILIDLERLRYPYSGIANVFRNLRKGFDEINTEFDINYFGKFQNRKNEERKWERWHKFYENFSSKYNLIHVSHQLSSYFQRNYKNTIKIVTLHDLNLLYENLEPDKQKKMLNKIRSNVINADYIVCISEYAKQDLIKHQHLLTFNKLKDIVVIHNGIEFPEYKIYPLGQFQNLSNKKYILNIGVLFSKKNQLSIINMLPYIEEDLVLVYSGEKLPYADTIRSRIKELDLENRVHFLKNISNEEKCAVIQNCEALLHPSIAEGFGIPPIEAMAFGKPVFLSKLTSLPEIGGDVAFYFENFEGNKMAEYYSEKMKYFDENKNELVPKIKNWIQQFDYKVMSKNYLDFYRKILS